MKCFNADFHIHTCLSPCADLTMTPNNIGEALSRFGIDWISVTDHNSVRNVRTCMRVMEKYGIKTIPGIEVQTSEDVHVLGYFPTCEAAELFGENIEDRLPKIDYDPEKNGYQLVVDEEDKFTGMVELPFGFSISLSLEETMDLIEKHGGIPVYAHIDRSLGVVEQLGFIPPFPESTVCEIYKLSKLKSYSSTIGKRAVISSSDAHNIDSFSNSKMIICCKERTFEEFRLALKKIDGREVRLCL